MTLTFDTVVKFAKSIVDMLLLWLILYYVLKSLRKNVKMVLLFKGILVIIILKIISDIFDLSTIGYLLNYVIITSTEEVI